MIQFNELRFSDDLGKLIIDCEIVDAGTGGENDGYYISAVYVDYFKNRYVTGAVNLDTAWGPYEPSTARKVTNVNIEVDVKELNQEKIGVNTFEKGLFYVFVECVKDAEDEDDEDTVVMEIGAVLDWHFVHEVGMKAVAAYEMSGKFNCDVPAGLKQFAILWHSFDLAIEAKDFDMLEMLWQRFTGYSGNGVKPCNCS